MGDTRPCHYCDDEIYFIMRNGKKTPMDRYGRHDCPGTKSMTITRPTMRVEVPVIETAAPTMTVETLPSYNYSSRTANRPWLSFETMFILGYIGFILFLYLLICLAYQVVTTIWDWLFT